MKIKSFRGQGKDFSFKVKCLKKLAYHFFGFSFLFCPPRSRVIIYDSILEFIKEITDMINSNSFTEDTED